MLFHDVVDGGDVPSDVYVVAENTQAKSATLNNGEFNESNPDIRFMIDAETGESLPENPMGIDGAVRKEIERAYLWNIKYDLQLSRIQTYLFIPI